MSKSGLLSVLANLLLCSALFGQGVPGNAVDFNVTDLDGKKHQLFDYLKSGKYVLIDFVTTW